jgi:hypothetical protein
VSLRAIAATLATVADPAEPAADAKRDHPDTRLADSAFAVAMPAFSRAVAGRTFHQLLGHWFSRDFAARRMRR